jgi:hypothetical protein
MTLDRDDRESIRTDMIKPVSDRVGRVEARMDTFDKRLQKTNETQAVISSGMDQFMAGLKAEQAARRENEGELFGLHREMQTDIAEVKTAVVGEQNKVKGIAVGALKTVGVAVALVGSLVGALGLAHAMGWLPK